MKKLFYFIGSFLAIIFTALLVIPYFFKDDIVKKVNEIIEDQLKAEVQYDPSEFSLSLLKHFPELSIQTGSIRLINKAPFNDTLASTDRMIITVDLFDLISEHVEIKQLFFHKPVINIKVLENGLANYDIVKSSGTEEKKKSETSEGNSDFKLSINHWELLDAAITYDDLASKTKLSIEGLNHRGSGDFSQNMVDLRSETAIKSLSFLQGKTTYLKNKHLLAEVNLALDIANTKFRFKKNNIKLENFALEFDGEVAMLPKDKIELDLTFESKENSFESLLSLVPKNMISDLSDINTKGDFKFSGFTKGTYSTHKLPAFGLKLDVKDGYLKYKKLPEAITNINLAVKVDNKNGLIDDTYIDIQSMNADFGTNPFAGKMRIKDLKKYEVEGFIKTKFNLADLENFYPMEGISTSGLLTADLKLNGYYDSLTHRVPKINANIVLVNGSLKTSELPTPLEEINLKSRITNSTGELKNTEVHVSDFKMMMNKELFSAKLDLENPLNPKWNVEANGKIDLSLLESMRVLEKGMHVEGLISADIKSAGLLSDLKEKKYHKIVTTGLVSLKDVLIRGNDLPTEVKIPEAKLSMETQKMNLDNFKAILGTSDVLANGYLKNYLAYALDENGDLEGNMNIVSNYINANELMKSPAKDSTATKTMTAPSLVLISEQFKLALNLKINKVDYDNLQINQINGKLELKDQTAFLNHLKFNTLDGQFKMNGKYNTKNVKRPSFHYDFIADNLSIQKAYASFNTIKKLAPAAENLRGYCDMKLDINGFMKKGMNVDLEKLNGNAKVDITNASIVNSDLIKKINQLAKIQSDKARLEDVKINADIVNGKVITKPFDVKIGEYNSIFSGTNDFKGNINYNIALYVPTKGISETINSFVSKLTNNQNTKIVGSMLVTDFEVKGKYDKPRIKVKKIRAINEEVKTSKESNKKSDSNSPEKEKIQDQDEQLKKAVDEAAKKAKELFKGLF